MVSTRALSRSACSRVRPVSAFLPGSTSWERVLSITHPFTVHTPDWTATPASELFSMTRSICGPNREPSLSPVAVIFIPASS